MINHILLATNGSEKALKAEDYALFLAKQCNAELIVLYVHDDRLIHYGQVDQLITETAKKEFISYVKGKNDTENGRVLDNFSHKAEKAGVFFTSCIRTGDPDKEIIVAAGERMADLLIMGGLKSSGSCFMPSSKTAGKVVKKSACPVFVAA